MNNLFKELINLLNKEFKKFDLDESVQLNLSKLPEFDMQINNLVKHNKADFFNNLQKSIIEIIDSTNLFQPVEENELGFLNLVFNHNVLIRHLTNKKSDFLNNSSQKIIFDYGGPNIGKPLHVGHMRTLNIGRSLYNIHSFIGNNVISDIHLGDWGMPIAQIITYLENESIDINSLDSSQLEIIYPKASEQYKDSEKFKIRAQEINKLLNDNDSGLLKIWGSIKNISLERFIYALGIRHIGLENAKLISRHLKSIENFLDLSKMDNYDELLNIDGIGETQINSIKTFFKNNTNLKVLNNLNEVLSIKNSIELKKDGLLKNKTFMLTGKLNGISRAEAKSLIEENSGTTVSSVSKKLNFLIVGDKPTKRKVDNAKELNIKIINQIEWLKMLNLNKTS